MKGYQTNSKRTIIRKYKTNETGTKCIIANLQDNIYKQDIKKY